MSGVSLDTSGGVRFVEPFTEAAPLIRWPDLSPFEQGYVEAMLTPCEALFYSLTSRHAGFSDLAPETLAAIRKDCAGLAEIYSDTTAGGAMFWANRQRGSFQGLNPDTRFLPQTVTLGDDGKVRIAPVDGTTEHSSRSGRTT